MVNRVYCATAPRSYHSLRCLSITNLPTVCRQDLANAPEIRAILEAKQLFALMTELFQVLSLAVCCSTLALQQHFEARQGFQLRCFLVCRSTKW